MAKAFIIILFITTGILPLCMGISLACREDYIIAVGCFIIAVFGFQQVYRNAGVQELIDSLTQKILDQEKELEQQKLDFVNQKNKMTQNLADIFSSKVDQQEKIIARQRKELSEASRFLEHKNREIRLLREDYYDD